LLSIIRFAKPAPQPGFRGSSVNRIKKDAGINEDERGHASPRLSNICHRSSKIQDEPARLHRFFAVLVLNHPLAQHLADHAGHTAVFLGDLDSRRPRDIFLNVDGYIFQPRD